jgi:hypothetical protein
VTLPYLAWQEELFRQLLVPLFAEIGWRDNQQPSLTLSPLLGKDQPCLNGLPKTDFVRQQRAS